MTTRMYNPPHPGELLQDTVLAERTVLQWLGPVPPEKRDHWGAGLVEHMPNGVVVRKHVVKRVAQCNCRNLRALFGCRWINALGILSKML